MKNSSFKSLLSLVPSVIAVICLIMLASSIQPEKKADNSVAATVCCRGYNMPMTAVRKFMLDSLKSGAFEGGIYSKKDLLTAINSINGDSVYLLNAKLNCLLNEGNGMIITSELTGDVRIVSRNPYCSPCPQRACCPQRICATRIERTCINYRSLPGINENTGFTAGSDMTASQ